MYSFKRSITKVNVIKYIKKILTINFKGLIN